MAIGCFGLWKAALGFDFARGYRLWTIAQHKIDGLVSNEAKYLRRHGFGSGDSVARYLRKKVAERSDTRLDRWIFDHLGSSPEELLEEQKKRLKQPIFRSLQEAADALKQANNLEHSEVYSDGGDGNDIERGCEEDGYSPATEPLEQFRDVHDSHNPLKWSPQLGDSFTGINGKHFCHKAPPWFVLAVATKDIPGHRTVSAIVDFWIAEFCDPKPQPKPVYPPCRIKPTGVVLHPIDAPYWTQPSPDLIKCFAALLERPVEKFKKPYDPDRREVAPIRQKDGKTKRQYRQRAASPNTAADNEWLAEYTAHPYRASYVKYVEENEAMKLKLNVEPDFLANKRNQDVRETKQAPGGPVAEIVVRESRRSCPQRFHVSEQRNPPCAGE
jgi:hypothetical protein